MQMQKPSIPVPVVANLPNKMDAPKDTLSMVNQFLNQNQDAMAVNFGQMGKNFKEVNQNLLDSDDDNDSLENTQDLLQSKNVNYGLLDDESDNDLDLSQSEMNTVERPRPMNRDEIAPSSHQPQKMPNFADLRSIDPVTDTSNFSKNLADEFLGSMSNMQQSQP